MRVFILITLLLIGYLFTLASNIDNKIEIGRTESIHSLYESEIERETYEKDVYYVETDLKSNITVF